MMIATLVLWLTAAQAAGAGAGCPEGAAGDLRLDTPVLVVASRGGGDELRPPSATALALYADGHLIARRKDALYEWWLETEEVERFLEELGYRALLKSWDEIGSGAGTGPAEALEVLVWQRGCRRRLDLGDLRELPALAALGQPARAVPRAQVAEARAALARLHPTLRRFIGAALTKRPGGGKPWCRGAGCQGLGKRLPYQDFWK